MSCFRVAHFCFSWFALPLRFVFHHPSERFPLCRNRIVLFLSRTPMEIKTLFDIAVLIWAHIDSLLKYFSKKCRFLCKFWSGHEINDTLALIFFCRGGDGGWRYE